MHHPASNDDAGWTVAHHFQRPRRGRCLTPVTRMLSLSHHPGLRILCMRAAAVAGLMLVALELASTESVAQSGRPVPVADYHVHLVSESATKLLVAPTLPEVALPAEIDLVIREWERVTKAPVPTSLAALFTADGLLAQANGWARGTAAIRGAAAHFEPEDFRVRAHAISVVDTVAMVTGSLQDQASNPVRE